MQRVSVVRCIPRNIGNHPRSFIRIKVFVAYNDKPHRCPGKEFQRPSRLNCRFVNDLVAADILVCQHAADNIDVFCVVCVRDIKSVLPKRTVDAPKLRDSLCKRCHLYFPRLPRKILESVRFKCAVRTANDSALALKLVQPVLRRIPGHAGRS